jgi:hypothetical protein
MQVAGVLARQAEDLFLMQRYVLGGEVVLRRTRLLRQRSMMILLRYLECR